MVRFAGGCTRLLPPRDVVRGETPVLAPRLPGSLPSSVWRLQPLARSCPQNILSPSHFDIGRIEDLSLVCVRMIDLSGNGLSAVATVAAVELRHVRSVGQ